MTRPIFLISRARASACSSSASNISFDSAFNLSGRFSVSVATPPLFSRRTKLLIVRLHGTVPPSAAERLKQAGRVGITIRFGLDQGQFREVVSLLCVQHRDQTDRSQFALMLSEIKGPLGGAIGLGTGPQGITIRLQRTQAISHILAGQYDSAAILCRRLIEGCVRSTFLVQERPGI